ncbi:MAG: hypothetical protein U0T11_06890 [Chitinophagaceae bacterium]
MKKSILFFFCLVLIASANAQNGGFGMAFKGIYAMPTRAGFDKYLKVLSDSVKLPSTLKNDKVFGVGISFLRGNKKAEFEAGGDIVMGVNTQGKTGTNSATMKTTDIALHMGGNYKPSKYFMLGAKLVLNNIKGKFDMNEAPVGPLPTFDSPPDTDFNIFKGYSFGLRAQAGLMIPVSKSTDNELGQNVAIRIVPFYQLGISKCNYYNMLDNRLKNYNGDKKTASSFAGVSFDVVIGF